MVKPQHGYVGHVSRIVSRLSFRMRRRIHDLMMEVLAPTPQTRVLDVGVMADPDPGEPEANYLEQLYPYPHRIVGLTAGDPARLADAYPDCTFVKGDACSLPFADQSFDIVFSAAVIEHVGSRERQSQLVREACRVGRNVFITTPNRFYPVEAHSRLPLTGYLPPEAFRAVLRSVGFRELATVAKLNPLGESDLRRAFSGGPAPEIYRLKLFDFTQNLVAVVKRQEAETLHGYGCAGTAVRVVLGLGILAPMAFAIGLVRCSPDRMQHLPKSYLELGLGAPRMCLRGQTALEDDAQVVAAPPSESGTLSARSISVVVPALNEAANTVARLLMAQRLGLTTG